MNLLRSLLYFIARILDDINAVVRGTILKRIARRIAGHFASKLLRRLIR